MPQYEVKDMSTLIAGPIMGACNRNGAWESASAATRRTAAALCPGRKAGAVVVGSVMLDRDGLTSFPILRISRRIVDWLGFRGRPSDERGSGHQIECGIFQYQDLGRRRMAQKRHFGGVSVRVPGDEHTRSPPG